MKEIEVKYGLDDIDQYYDEMIAQKENENE